MPFWYGVSPNIWVVSHCLRVHLVKAHTFKVFSENPYIKGIRWKPVGTGFHRMNHIYTIKIQWNPIPKGHSVKTRPKGIRQKPVSVKTRFWWDPIAPLKGLPFDVEKWIHLKDERKKLKLLQRARHINACRNKSKDKERVFNFGIITSLKFVCVHKHGLERGVTDPHYLFLSNTIIILKLVQTITLVKREWCSNVI
jgi:hypothetical protein